MGIKTIAITNHNTIDGLDEARQLCDKCGIQLVNGVELSCQIQGESADLDGTLVHVLGYDIDNDQTLFNSYLDDIERRFGTRHLTHRQGIDLIKKLHGVAVWAHPARVYMHDKFTAAELEDVVGRFCACGLDGVEVFHPDNLKDRDVVRVLLEIAKRHNLLVTLGSDSHNLLDKDRFLSLKREPANFNFDGSKIVLDICSRKC